MNALVSPTTGAAAAAPGLTLRLTRDARDLQQIAPAWLELLADSAASEPTLEPAYATAWWEVFGRGRRLTVASWWQGEQLIGLAPLCRHWRWYRPGIPFRRFDFLGCDVPEQDGVCSDYLNVIARRGHEKSVALLLAETMRAGALGGWDECVFSAMDGTGDMPQLLADAFRNQGYAVDTDPVDIAPYLILPASWDEYLRSLPKRRRQGLNAALRNFEKWAPARETRVERAETPAQLLEGFQILTDLHRTRWATAGQRGAFSDRFIAFHDRYARHLLEQGRLDLCWLVVRGEPVAATYSFRNDRKAYFYQCGRKTGLPSTVRLGIVMVIFAIQHAMAQRLREFDFLAGAADYKREFTLEARPIVTVRVTRRGLRDVVRRVLRSGARAWRRRRATHASRDVKSS